MPKLTLRDLFYVVTLAVVLAAWWVDRSPLKEENRQLWQEFLDRGPRIY